MATKEAQKSDAAIAGEEGFEPIADETQSLPPLLILEVGDSVRGILKTVNLVEDDDKAGKFRNFYRMVLTQTATGVNKETKRVSFDKGALVSVPGSGGLDYSLGLIARRVSGQPDDAKPNWAAIRGHLFTIERTPDEVMAKGKYRGRPVKTYKVGHASPRKA